MTDYKQLCTELIDELEGWVAYGGDEIDLANAHVLIDRARAELAKPEPEPPSLKDQIITAIFRDDKSLALKLLNQALPE